jgi:hypothetical protein
MSMIFNHAGIHNILSGSILSHLLRVQCAQTFEGMSGTFLQTTTAKQLKQLISDKQDTRATAFIHGPQLVVFRFQPETHIPRT